MHTIPAVYITSIRLNFSVSYGSLFCKATNDRVVLTLHGDAVCDVTACCFTGRTKRQKKGNTQTKTKTKKSKTRRKHKNTTKEQTWGG
jgi:hypothetical protein